MFSLSAVMMIGGLLAGQTDQATAGTKGVTEIQVRSLVRQLDATRLVERETAEAQLLDMGPGVLDLLPQSNARQSAEIKLRLGRIRQKLQQEAAQAGAREARITLRGQAMPLSEVLAALQKQSGNKIVDIRSRFGQQAPDTKLDVAFEKIPFWDALDQVLDKAGLVLYASGQPKTLSVIARTDEMRALRTGTASYAGPFRIEPVRVEASRHLRRLSGESLVLTLEVAWEPRIEPIGLTQPMDNVVAVDGQGNNLAVADPKAKVGVPMFGSSVSEIALALKLPPRSVDKIGSLKGTVMAMIPGPVETFAFDNLTDPDLLAGKAVEKRVAGVTVAIERVRKNNSIWQIDMRVQFDNAGQALESHRGWIYENEAYLEGPDGKPHEPDSSMVAGQSTSGMRTTYMFAIEGTPEKHKFVYKTPSVIVTTGFEYEITDIDLP